MAIKPRRALHDSSIIEIRRRKMKKAQKGKLKGRRLIA
jgi:hypothetical protein